MNDHFLRRMAALVMACLGIVPLAACRQDERPVSAEALEFPVVLIIPDSSLLGIAGRADVVTRADGLAAMRVGLYSSLSDSRSAPPLVIDMAAAVFHMRNIKGEHGGLWMMMNPNGMMPITYSLHPMKSSFEQARDLIAKSRFLGPVAGSDTVDRRRSMISSAGSMREIVDRLRETSGL